MKFGLALIAAVAAQKGCGKKCTQQYGSDVLDCEEHFTTPKEFAQCYFKVTGAYVQDRNLKLFFTRNSKPS